MNKLQYLLIFIGLLMIGGAILLIVFPSVMKYVFSVLGFALGIFLITSVLKKK
ncbi:MAG: hypothetical protein IKU52_03400 [Clostridia bacterium]|nr:hypothetical protein [Clostridia bacterium]